MLPREIALLAAKLPSHGDGATIAEIQILERGQGTVPCPSSGRGYISVDTYPPLLYIIKRNIW